MDVYKKWRPEASERRLVMVGRLSTGAIVALSVAWIPFIRYLNAEIYQYLQSVQAYVGAPITATFLTGVLWRRATAAAALTTLIAGGIIGATRFLLDILRNALGWDLGPLNAVVAFSFLNFSVIVFFFCVALMVMVSLATPGPQPEKVEGLTLNWRGTPVWRPAEVVVTMAVGAVIIGLWWHFA